MKNIGIETPCTENWNDMTPSAQGAFCQKCASNVHDFSGKSNDEIKETLRSLIGQKVCGRITQEQEDSLNKEFNAWQFSSRRSIQSAMLFSLIVVFGLTLFSCTNEKEKQTIQHIQQSVSEIVATQINKIEIDEEVSSSEIISIVPQKVQLSIYDRQVCAIGYEKIYDEIYVVEEINKIENYHILGGMRASDHYTEYLVQTAIEKEIELDENGIAIPTEFTSKVYPNPASASTTLEIGVPEKERMVIHLYDMNGKFIQEIFQGKSDRGTFSYPIDLIDLQPGIYLITIHSKDYSETIRVSKI